MGGGVICVPERDTIKTTGLEILEESRCNDGQKWAIVLCRFHPLLLCCFTLSCIKAGERRASVTKLRV